MTKYIVTGGAEIEHDKLHFKGVDIVDLTTREHVEEHLKRTGEALAWAQRFMKIAHTVALGGCLATPVSDEGLPRDLQQKNREFRNMMREELDKRLRIGEDSP
jgi:hypothetical protein